MSFRIVKTGGRSVWDGTGKTSYVPTTYHLIRNHDEHIAQVVPGRKWKAAIAELWSIADNHVKAEQEAPAQATDETGKLPLKSISFTPYELGISEQVFTTWKDANAYISRLAGTLTTGGYSKCDFSIEWQDGEPYKGRWDLLKEHAENKRHLQDRVHLYLTTCAESNVTWYDSYTVEGVTQWLSERSFEDAPAPVTTPVKERPVKEIGAVQETKEASFDMRVTLRPCLKGAALMHQKNIAESIAYLRKGTSQRYKENHRECIAEEIESLFNTYQEDTRLYKAIEKIDIPVDTLPGWVTLHELKEWSAVVNITGLADL